MFTYHVYKFFLNVNRINSNTLFYTTLNSINLYPVLDDEFVPIQFGEK